MTSGERQNDLVPVGTPIDLDNCAREPIHIPGSIQPRGVLAVVREPGFEVRQVSANVADLLGRSVDTVLGRHLSVLIGAEQAALVEQAASTSGDLRQRNPLECVIDVAGEPRAFDAILRREPGDVLLVELEVAYGERPFSFPNTYQAVRRSVEDLNQAATLTELYDTAARAVRDLTGFDRVMVYRYDEEYNGEIVAESKREDLNSFLGLHYPSTDIPAQARALYEKNWIRLISDVDYTPVPLVPAIDPASGAPRDLTLRHAAQRLADPRRVPAEHGCARIDVDFFAAARTTLGAHRLPSLRRSASAAVRHPGGGRIPRLDPVAAARRPVRGRRTAQAAGRAGGAG